jgi:hypothetical protein
LRDFHELEFFFDQIASDPDKSKYQDMVAKLLDDSVLPQKDRMQSPGRNAQAEAFVFAVCQSADMRPSFGEPDVVCEIDQQRLGIAVKRLKTPAQFEKRLKEAAEQIQRSGLLGVISVEVTLAVNPKNHSIITPEGDGGIGQWWSEKMRDTVTHLNDGVWSSVGAKGVLGVFLHEHCPVNTNGHYVLQSMTYGRETASDDKRRLWSQFQTRFINGLPNLQKQY